MVDEGMLIFESFNFKFQWNVDGTLDVSASDFNSEISFTVHGKDGHPQIDLNSCSIDVQDVDVSIAGGGFLGWLVRTLVSIFVTLI